MDFFIFVDFELFSCSILDYCYKYGLFCLENLCEGRLILKGDIFSGSHY